MARVKAWPRFFCDGVTCAAVIFAFTACRSGEDPAYARDSTVVMAVRDVRDILPDAVSLDFLFFLPLATQDGRGELEGRLARSWEHSADHKEYTFHLRTDVRWQDGVPTTAHDVKFTLDLLSEDGVPGFGIEKATVVDDSTVTIRAENPEYLDYLVYYPKHLLEGLDPKQFWKWEFWLKPVGNGPYRFVRHVPQTLMEFEANPDYYGAKPRIDRVILKFVGDAWLAELLAGNVDIASGDLAQVSRIVRDPRFRVYYGIPYAAYAIYWRTDHPLFRDARVRRALTLAIDRPELARRLNLPSWSPITDAPRTFRQSRRGEFPEAQALPYDPEEARRILEAAGWVDRDGDGVREREGRPFRFTAKVWNEHQAPQLAVYVQDYLRRVGVQMEVVMLEDALMWKNLTGDFDALLFRHNAGPEAQRRNFGRENRTGYRSPAAFDVIDRIMATADPDEKDRLYGELAKIFRAELPLTRLVWKPDVTFVHRRVRGLSTPFRADANTNMENLWVDGER
ncbi:MAG TPA: ABC transporter substrate-binding protein [Gemmatimonadaceae bacterium]|nr:ABC transporter substrate-binding protein [Gemmatimonadaceae bacterium]